MKTSIARNVCVTLSIGMLFLSVTAMTKASTRTAEQTGQEEQNLIDLINGYRLDHGVAGLLFNQNAYDAAFFHSTDMATNDFFGHNGSDGTSMSQRLDNFDVGLPATELIASGGSANVVFNLFLNSPDHLAFILGDEFNIIGVSQVSEMWTVVLAHSLDPQPQMVVSPTSIDFGSTTTNSSTSKTFNISNYGSAGANLTVNALAISGTNASDFSFASSDYPLNLQSGQSKVVEVTFTPSSAGVRTALLTISSNDPYNPTEQITLSGTGLAGKTTQVITFLNIGNQNFDNQQILLAASASSGLPVSFELISGSASLLGNELTVNGLGEITVKASQAGNNSYFPAADVIQSFMILPGLQTITFPPIPNIDISNPSISVEATSSAALPIQYLAAGPIIYLNGEFTLVGTGEAIIIAIQSGNELFGPAVPVVRSFEVTDLSGTGTLNSAWFADLDGDGFGNGNSALVSCLPLPNHVQNNQDCDDTNANTNPNNVEVNDGVDNNCDGEIDEGFGTPEINDLILQATCVDNPTVLRRWKITNPNGVILRIDWEITGSLQKSWVDLPPGDSYLTTIVVPKNPNTLRVYWHNEKGESKFIEAQTNTSKCVKGSSSARLSSESEDNTSNDSPVPMRVYPNPANSMITLEIESDTESEVPLQFISNNGSIYQQSNVRFSKGANFITHDVSTMTDGIYIIRVGNKSIRFIKE